VTTLGTKGVGDPVNLEVDVIAKYTERLLEGQLAAVAAGGVVPPQAQEAR
jgi:riboflavin synthase